MTWRTCRPQCGSRDSASIDGATRNPGRRIQRARGSVKLSPLSAGAALFTPTCELVDGGPSPCFRGFHAEPLFLVAGFDVFRLTLLFVSVTGFIALRHWWSFLSGGTPWVQFAKPLRFCSHNRRRLWPSR